MAQLGRWEKWQSVWVADPADGTIQEGVLIGFSRTTTGLRTLEVRYNRTTAKFYTLGSSCFFSTFLFNTEKAARAWLGKGIRKGGSNG